VCKVNTSVGTRTEQLSPFPAMPKLILCVEDEHLSAEAVRRTLNYAGYEVQTEGTAAAALSALQARRPDLILLDLLLPDVNGYSFIDLLRDHDDFDQIPIVIVSGCASPEAQSLGRELGARAYLIKPFTAQELIECVHGVFGTKPKSDR
jgi:DNA-binding response OmpR family regulator